MKLKELKRKSKQDDATILWQAREICKHLDTIAEITLDRDIVERNWNQALSELKNVEKLETEVEFLSGQLATFSNRILAAADLDGFGCACTPHGKCGTCKAREIISSAINPVLKELNRE